ncbi:unnamed protein product, partial [marine sediment metagenome]
PVVPIMDEIFTMRPTLLSSIARTAYLVRIIVPVMFTLIVSTICDSCKVALHILKHYAPNFKYFSFLERGSDERQYCSPRVDLPVVSIMRSKYGTYPEYHTSLDDLSVISPEGLLGAYKAIKKCLVALEKNHIYQVTTYCEPQLGKRGLYPTISEKKANPAKNLMNLIAYCDGNNDLIDIAELINLPIDDCYSMIENLLVNDLLEEAGLR